MFIIILVKKMKKTIIWVIFALISGAILGRLTFNKYENLNVTNVVRLDDSVYMIKYGSYNNYDDMLSSMSSFERYVYVKNNDIYNSYIAISKSSSNINKIFNIYKDNYPNIKIEMVNIQNNEFIQNLDEYEKLLDATSDSNSLLIIENQILSCYEKMVDQDE